MRKMTSNEIRNTWLNFFKSKGHCIEPGASLVPHDDPTLLWINAGVAALKKYFDGSVIPQNPRICNVQKAIRTNDIENVGHTARHHTFFEMMGNFSIGDYFRDEAMEFAFELLTSANYFAIPKEKLYITYHPSDKDTLHKWKSLGMAEENLIPCEGNFWEIGEGPCGPDTEFFFDRGEKYDPNHFGVKMIQEDIENDRYIEIWNIVFSQFNSKANLKREDYPELPHKNIDTGAGLERFACILQEAETNYETDLFLPIIQRCAQLSPYPYDGIYKTSYRIIADHLRTCTFALADGAMFSNEGRGYVLRRLLRRAVRHGKKLAIKGMFLAQLVDEVLAIMQDFYPYLLEKADYIKQRIQIEEEKFLNTLSDGEKRLEELYHKNKQITGEDAFLLYDTYGFPFELTLEFANEKGLTIDQQEFTEAMEQQKELARKNRGNRNSMKAQNQEFMDFLLPSQFIGYDTLQTTATIIAIFEKNQVVLDKTPFYAQMGGEVADTGRIYNDHFSALVVDCQKMPNGQHIHQLEIEFGQFNKDEVVVAQVDEQKRKQIAANHSATHLLHQALKDVLGNHVNQHGSMVSEKNIRFDFNHFSSIQSEQLLEVEKIVKNKIADGLKVHTYQTSLVEAKKQQITALFDEKYGDEVRVVDMDYSKELCGGCHIDNTKNILDFSIASIESKGSGIYRICAVSHSDCLENLLSLNAILVEEYQTNKQKLDVMKHEAVKEKINISDLPEIEVSFLPTYQTILDLKEKGEKIKIQLRLLEKRFADQKQSAQNFELEDITLHHGKTTDYILMQTNYEQVDFIKQYADLLSEKYPFALILLVNVYQEKLVFVAKKGKNALENIHCGNIVKTLAQICLGNGGGRSDMAQAGGKDISKLPEVLNYIGENI